MSRRLSGWFGVFGFRIFEAEYDCGKWEKERQENIERRECGLFKRVSQQTSRQVAGIPSSAQKE